MALFGKKEEPSESKQPVSLVDLIGYMKNQGYSDDQVVEYLQREGYKSSQIFEAISQAQLKAETKTPISGPPSVEEMPMPSAPSIPAVPSAPAPLTAPAPEKSFQRERIEELTEAIIEEKWSALLKNVEKIVSWKERTETRVLKLEEQFKNLQNNFDKLHSAILGKVAEYSKNIAEVGTDVKAMNEVFKKVLPTLTENVNELSRLTKKVKAQKKK